MYSHACQYLVLYLADDEKTLFVSEISRGQGGEDTAAAETFENVEKEVSIELFPLFVMSCHDMI